MMEAKEQYLDDGASAEDKFFGVKATFEKKKPKVEDEDSDVEIIDDRPPEDQRSPKAKSNDDDIDDDELGQYSEKVQKRLNKLKYEFHEERRQRESAERMREEAVRAAQQLANKNKEYESLVSRGEQALIEQVRERAQLSLNQAKEAYRKAYEEGDTDSILDSQEKLYRAQAELAEAEKYRSSYSQNAQQYKAQQEELRRQEIARQAALSVAQQQQVQPQVSPEAQAWAEKNQWFMRQGYEEMTALAYGSHEAAIRKGIQPNSPDYFDYIDNRMRAAFPEHDWSDERTNGRTATATTGSRPSSVVAPSGRSNGAKPRKVQLTSTQVALAKRLGLTNKQYADQLLKEKG